MNRPWMACTSMTIGAPDPRALADFYSRLLGWPVTTAEPPRPGQPPEDGWAQIRPPRGEGGLTLNFEFEQDFAVPTWPSRPGEQQIQEHLDIAVHDLEAAVAWATSCGGRLHDFQPQDDNRVMLDPAGHPFCLYLTSG
ncbi:MAG TPA: VOC family protein [Propionibacteriaceae bacterium]|nr:VOC family protein [Propionibacteriaceae bacterium]